MTFVLTDQPAAQPFKERGAKSTLLGDQQRAVDPTCGRAIGKTFDKSPANAPPAHGCVGDDMAEHRNRAGRTGLGGGGGGQHAHVAGNASGVTPHPGAGEIECHLGAGEHGAASGQRQPGAEIVGHPAVVLGVRGCAEQGADDVIVIVTGDKRDAIGRAGKAFLIETEEMPTELWKQAQPQIFPMQGRGSLNVGCAKRFNRQHGRGSLTR